MQIVLLVAGLVSWFVGQARCPTGVLLILLTLLNAFMGLNQEGKAAAAVAALQGMMISRPASGAAASCVEVPAEELVPGDIVAVEAGDRVPADGRIISAATLEIDESALTGESLPVSKDTGAVAAVDTPLGDRTDMAYMNTNVTRGSGELLVTGTGMSTEVGQDLRACSRRAEDGQPAHAPAHALTNQLLVIAGSRSPRRSHRPSRGQAFDTLFITAVAFAVSAIPTGLPAVVTTILSTGTQQLAKAHAIMKRLRSVETLGSTSAINSDKTGTLTLNQMTAVSLAIPGRRYDDHRHRLRHRGPDQPRRAARRTCPGPVPAAHGPRRRRRGEGRRAHRRPDRGRPGGARRQGRRRARRRPARRTRASPRSRSTPPTR